MTSDMIKYQLSIVNYQFSKCHRFLTLSVPAACIYIRKLDVYIQFIFNCIVARSNNIGTVSFGSLDGLAIMGIKPFCS